MTNRFSVYLIMLFILLTGVSTNVAAEKERFGSPVFDQTIVASFPYAIKGTDTLFVDLYAPVDDGERARPLVLFVHGGGFSSGSRASNEIVTFAQKLTSYGYAVGSISYLLLRKNEPTGFGCDCPATEKIETFTASVEDINDALYYLQNKASDWRLDMEKVILAGSSAGAEAILMMAYGNFVADQQDRPFKIAGLIGLAGAITDLNQITAERAVPTLMFHGTCDNLVPFATASHHHCAPDKPGHLILHGSLAISSRLKDFGTPHWLHTTCGGGHELAGTPLTQYFDTIAQFCFEYVLQKGGEIRHTLIAGDDSVCTFGQFSFCKPYNKISQ